MVSLLLFKGTTAEFFVQFGSSRLVFVVTDVIICRRLTFLTTAGHQACIWRRSMGIAILCAGHRTVAGGYQIKQIISFSYILLFFIASL
jgi:hypothetical protein